MRIWTDRPAALKVAGKEGEMEEWDLAEGLFSRIHDLLFIYLFVLPALNPRSYGRARVWKASSRPMLVIGRSFE